MKTLYGERQGVQARKVLWLCLCGTLGLACAGNEGDAGVNRAELTAPTTSARPSIVAPLVTGDLTIKSAVFPSTTAASSQAPRATYVLAKGTRTAYSFQTTPNAACILQPEGATDPTSKLAVIADTDGLVRVVITSTVQSADVSNVELTCLGDDGKTTVYPVTVKFASGAPLAASPVISAGVPPGSYERPALSGDPMSFTQEELFAGGYPPRPDPDANPAGYTKWLDLASQPATIIPPKLVERPGRRNSSSSRNWSGYVATGSLAYIAVQGFWYVPYVSNWGDSSFWIGLDGYSDSDLIQEGSVSQFFVTSGVGYTYSYPWIELWPQQSEVQISNFPVYPGTPVFEVTWWGDANGTMNAPGSHYGWFYAETEDTHRAYTIGEYVTSSFLATSAEWIMEAPSVGGAFQPLADYGTTEMGYAATFITQYNGWTNYAQHGGTLVDMYNGSTLLSSAATNGSEDINYTFHAAN